MVSSRKVINDSCGGDTNDDDYYLDDGNDDYYYLGDGNDDDSAI